MLRNWVRSLFQGKTTSSSKRPVARKARLGLESLEGRELMSVSPALTLTQGNLFETNGATQQLIFTGVNSFAIAGNGMIVAKENNGYLEEQTVPATNTWVQLDTSVQSFAIAGNGVVVDLVLRPS